MAERIIESGERDKLPVIYVTDRRSKEFFKLAQEATVLAQHINDERIRNLSSQRHCDLRVVLSSPNKQEALQAQKNAHSAMSLLIELAGQRIRTV